MLRAPDIDIHGLPGGLGKPERHVGGKVHDTVDAFGRRQQIRQPHQIRAHDAHARVVLQVRDGIH